MRNGSYELVIAPETWPGRRYRGRYCYEHHLIWWQNTGEVLVENEQIHHKNENKRDNRFLNLEKLTKQDHGNLHSLLQTLPDEVKYETRDCVFCGASFRFLCRRRNWKTSKSPYTYCSRSCGAKAQWRRRRVRDTQQVREGTVNS